MRPAVVDASLVVDAILPVTGRESALNAMAGRELWAPAILDAEVASAVARLERGGVLTGAEADRAIDSLAAMPIDRIAADGLLRGAWALRHGVRIAEAFYVGVALAVDGDVLTRDGRLARAPGVPVSRWLARTLAPFFRVSGIVVSDSPLQSRGATRRGRRRDEGRAARVSACRLAFERLFADS